MPGIGRRFNPQSAWAAIRSISGFLFRRSFDSLRTDCILATLT